MVVEFRTRGVRRVESGLRQLRNTVRGNIAADAVNVGYRYAKRHAPVAQDRYGGGTRGAIRRTLRKQSGELILDQPRKRPGNRPYHLWMHGIGRYNISGHINKTADPFFMFTARKRMQDYVNKRLKKDLGNK